MNASTGDVSLAGLVKAVKLRMHTGSDRQNYESTNDMFDRTAHNWGSLNEMGV